MPVAALPVGDPAAVTVPASSPVSASGASAEQRLFDISAKLARARAEIGSVIFGQDEVIDQTLMTLMAGGHVLLIGVPGLAKTLLVETVATVMGLESSRIQCTPDLMPADIVGSEVLEQDETGKRSFRFIKGPVFTQFLMADEINRASPRTQSALLQAMQEGHVTVGGQPHLLPHPFHVLATQNPIEQEGTYPLPEAQLDRFLMQIDVVYPSRDAERRIMIETTGTKGRAVKPVLAPGDLAAIQAFVREIPVGEQAVETILSLMRRAQPDPNSIPMIRDYVS